MGTSGLPRDSFLEVKNPPANAGDIRDASLIPGWGRSPGGGNDNLLQHSCLENPMDRGAWWDTIYEVAKNQTRLSMHIFARDILNRMLILGGAIGKEPACQCRRCKRCGFDP